jgi:hypothetical protein
VRVYVGEREPESGRCRLWLVHEVVRPDLAELVELMTELRRLSQPPLVGESGSEREQRRADTLARKDALVSQLQAAEELPEPVELLRAGPHAGDGFDWSNPVGGSALAQGVLLAELGEEPPPVVCRKFREDIVDRVHDRWSFRLPAEEVWTWLEVNRRLVEEQVFERRQPLAVDDDDGASLAVPSAPAALDVEDTVSEAAASSVVRACEEAWTAIRGHHAELPEAVMVLGTGVERGRLVKLGHWWAGRWTADGEPRGEVLLAGEALHLKPEEVFEVLLHEAAHGLNAARGIKDTSRGGRYHNARFGTAAQEVGLVASAMPPYGLARTSLSPEARERYGASIERLGDVMRIARQIERGVTAGGTEGVGVEGRSGGEQEGDGRSRAKGRALAVCGCGRKLRVAPTVLAAGPIVCGLCEAEFTSGAEPSGTTPTNQHSVVDRTFVNRRQAALGVGDGQDAEPEAFVRRHSRIQAALRAAKSEMVPAKLTGPLSARLDRLEALASSRGAVLTDPPSATADQRQGVAELQEAFSDEDVAAATSWYERFGTLEEQPMPAGSRLEAERRARLARALLRADGTLRGPGVDIGGRQYTTGDRVAAAGGDPASGLPAGTPGTVEVVDAGAGHAEIDFATWGRLKVSLENTVAQVLQHDYAERSQHDGARPSGPDRDVELELQRAWTEPEA